MLEKIEFGELEQFIIKRQFLTNVMAMFGIGKRYNVLFKFPNGYGGSVIEGQGSYGMELAVVKFKGDSENFNLVYDTHIADEVLGHLTKVELLNTLEQIKNLEG